jgi:hypothetical protein
MTGTGIVPPDDFALHSDNEVSITIEPLGTLARSISVLACSREAGFLPPATCRGTAPPWSRTALEIRFLEAVRFLEFATGGLRGRFPGGRATGPDRVLEPAETLYFEHHLVAGLEERESLRP